MLEVRANEASLEDGINCGHTRDEVVVLVVHGSGHDTLYRRGSGAPVCAAPGTREQWR